MAIGGASKPKSFSSFWLSLFSTSKFSCFCFLCAFLLRGGLLFSIILQDYDQISI
jgi:hypothetical protein